MIQNLILVLLNMKPQLKKRIKTLIKIKTSNNRTIKTMRWLKRMKQQAVILVKKSFQEIKEEKKLSPIKNQRFKIIVSKIVYLIGRMVMKE